MRDAPVIRASLSTLPGQTVKPPINFAVVPSCRGYLLNRHHTQRTVSRQSPSIGLFFLFCSSRVAYTCQDLAHALSHHPSCCIASVCISFPFFCFLSISGYTPYVFQAWRRTTCGFCILFYPLIMSRFCFFFAITHIRSVSKKSWET